MSRPGDGPAGAGRALGIYDALLFDMDGTILTSDAAVARAWTAWAGRAGAPVGEVLAWMHGRTARDSISRFAPPGADLAAEIGWLNDLELRDVDGIAPLEGAGALLAALPPRRWAVVTSANRGLALRRIAAAGLPVPGVLVSSDDVARGKPDPEGYRRAAGALGVDGARCLVFEDAEAGIAAGLAAGAEVLRIGDPSRPTAHPVRATVASYARLKVGEAAGGGIGVSI
ncbi:MAG: HAD-IA family hydrolase [Paracoccaceae bacterium]